ncbi:hypothetical protein FPOA_02077 [Fusarium poae]|uniref:Uncharacterized protein n=1 Tax=Fusarium poae TaxID=36050 RepID=A0A1B8B601_FUSPO|nr:hypothetical protein FPOA_02077 [Fusarium poae]
MATRATGREIGACIAAAFYFKCPKFIQVFVYRAILYADEFSEGNAWIDDGVNIASDIEDILRSTTSRIVFEIKLMMEKNRRNFKLDPAGPEYTLILETHRIWPLSQLLGPMTDVWAKMETAAIKNPRYAKSIRDLQVRMKGLVAKTQNNCDVAVQRTQSMQTLLRCNK